MKIKCIIFDCDGLMFNTEYHVQDSWRRILNQYNIAIPDGFFDAITGAGAKEAKETFDANPEIKNHLAEIRADRVPYLQSKIDELGNINKPGLVELLSWLKTQDYLVCVASSSSIDYVKWLINSIGISTSFDTLVGGDQVSCGKPNPMIFLTAAKRLNVDPKNCLVIEDSKNGHLAASAAGMHRCFIEDTVKPDAQMQKLIEFQCDNLTQVIDLLQRLKESENED